LVSCRPPPRRLYFPLGGEGYLPAFNRIRRDMETISRIKNNRFRPSSSAVQFNYGLIFER